jgi:hypothetical protein
VQRLSTYSFAAYVRVKSLDIGDCETRFDFSWASYRKLGAAGGWSCSACRQRSRIFAGCSVLSILSSLVWCVQSGSCPSMVAECRVQGKCRDRSPGYRQSTLQAGSSGSPAIGTIQKIHALLTKNCCALWSQVYTFVLRGNRGYGLRLSAVPHSVY